MIKLDSSRDALLLDGDCGLCHQLAFFMDSRLATDANIAYRPINSKCANFWSLKNIVPVFCHKSVDHIPYW